MSVQVRRRREAASFLSSYIGAQGELLVDTTNNRVQVHDGATPGGWPAAGIGDLPGRNALVNGTFVVNQRGYASGAALAANDYAHDRWKAGAGGCTYAYAQAVGDTAITVTAGSLLQIVGGANVFAGAWWLTWVGTAAARVYQGAPGAYSAGVKVPIGGITVNALLVTGLALNTNTAAEFSSGTVGLVQLEAALPNAGPTRFERRHYGAEFALCQRYYQSATGVLVSGYNVAGGNVYLDFGLATPMRAAPTVLFSGQGYSNASAFTTNTVFANHVRLQVTITSTGSGYGIATCVFTAEL